MAGDSRVWRGVLALAGFVLSSVPAWAVDAELLRKLASAETSTKVEAIEALALAADAHALRLLTALRDGSLQVSASGAVVIVQDGQVLDAATGQALASPPGDLESVTANNRIRGRIEAALSALRLVADDPQVRLKAAQELEASPATPAVLPVVEKALDKEQDSRIKPLLALIKAGIDLKNTDPTVRLAAVRVLGESRQGKTRTLLAILLETESVEEIRREAGYALKSIERRLVVSEYGGRLFTGLSLGSILLLVALGLAITYGLLGVINMAHGEMLMTGAYATFVMQQIVRQFAPAWFDWYLVMAVPFSFACAALVGIALERTVIRWLYGRPLETLLATWGISLFLIQLARQIFGPQNVEVSNPSWMSGGIEFTNVTLPYSRIVIIAFALAVLAAMWFVLVKTRLGLFIRGVTQNRGMAACVGVNTRRVDVLAFGLGSGIAGLAGCALSQIGNVGPDLGQSYIIDSFMVVVLGGVGQLAGTVYAALGLGVASKFLEPYIGAVPTKIMILVMIIAFIQKRPRGLFALKGRAVEA
ncbi:MAG: urea ABC transporter permease subunit UrtB [Betaproteobacteria bacterium]|nr:urea ABC transporter permease subunit UrtB [Betaproteobacteria bacterium]